MTLEFIFLLINKNAIYTRFYKKFSDANNAFNLKKLI